MSGEQEPLKVFFFGDSICFGEGVALHKGWVPRLSAKLTELGEKARHPVLVSNLGVSGNTTRMALERMPYDIQGHEPHVVIVQFGMNDCNHWETDRGNPRVSIDAFRANLEEIVKRATTFGAHRVIMHTNHPSGRDVVPMPHTNLTYQQSNARYNGAIREAAEACGGVVELIDIEAIVMGFVGDRPERLQELLLPAPDLLHLSERGHDLYFDAVAPVASSIVLDLLDGPRGQTPPVGDELPAPAPHG
jgi:lysophospholipase L1-like esterase